MSIETKRIGGHILEIKQEERNGQLVGIIAGYIATWDIDRGAWGVKDQFVRGAFADSIRELQVKNRQIRLKDQHGRVVGGFPINSVHEDETGLFAIGEINLQVQQGAEMMALLRQGVLEDFSIGFTAVEESENEGLRKITKAIIWEGSVVDEPMNPFAKITDVKSVTPFQDLQLADRDREWKESEAIERVREFTKSEDSPSEDYKNAFVWYDKDNAKNFDGYNLLIADVIDGKLMVVPNAIFAAADTLSNDSKGIDTRPMERYYGKMNLPNPFEGDNKKYFIADDVRDWTARDLEKALRKSGSFSKSAAKILTSKFKNVDKPPKQGENNQQILDELKSIENLLK